MYTRFEDTQEAVINPWDIVKKKSGLSKGSCNLLRT